MIAEPGDGERDVNVNETFHEQTDDELSERELRQIEADDQAIQTILLGLPEDIYAAVDSCETAQEIWLRVQQMMKGSDIRIQEKKAKLFNERERFTYNEGESIESYYHPDYTQLYDFLKYNQKEVDELKAERLEKIQDPLALMANSNNPYASPAPHQDQSPFNQNFVQQPMTNPEDITDPTTAMNMALTLMAKAFKLNYSTPTNNNQRISSNLKNRQIAQPGMNMGQDRQMQMIGGNGGNQFKQYAGQNAGNLNGYNAVQNVRNQIGNGNLVAARAEGNAAGQNPNQIRCYNWRGFGHYARNCTARPRRRDAAYLQTQLLIAQKEEAGIQLQAEEYDLMAAAADLDEIKEVNANCILMANLQQASSSGTQTDSTPVYDSDGSAENDWYKKCDEFKYDKISYDKAYKDMQQKIERLQAQLGDLKGKSKDTSCVSNTQNQVFQKLENANVELEFQIFNYAKENAHLKTTYKNLFDSIFVTHAQTETKIASLQNELQCNIYKNAKLRTQLFKKVSNQKDNTQDSSKNTKFAKQPNVEILSKIGETNALSKPVTSNSVSTPQVSKGLNNDKVIAPGMFRNRPDKVSREAKKVPNTVSASSRTKPITVSQPSVITKKGMNSNSNGLSSAGLDNIKTKRPQPRSNTKNDRVPSASKSSRSKNKEVKVEEHHRNLLLSKKNKHISSACNNSKIDSQDVISKVVCTMCKKCLISVNHDECLVNYVNGKKSHGRKHKANVAKMKRKRNIGQSNSESHVDCSNGDNACTSNAMEPKIKRFPNSTSLLGRLSRFVCGVSIQDMQQKIERLQAQLGELKGKCKDTSWVSDTQNQVFQKLENANVELEFQQPIAKTLPKIGETDALSKPVTSNSISTPQMSKGVNNDK
nr:hypothetical protein [Tanacetum cinerariifolium]